MESDKFIVYLRSVGSGGVEEAKAKDFKRGARLGRVGSRSDGDKDGTGGNGSKVCEDGRDGKGSHLS
jgi:hypothetical protein